MNDIHQMSESIHDMKLLIAPFYLLIGFAIYLAGRKARDVKQKVAVYALTAIFVLCDIAGYAGPAMGFPHWMIFAAHLGLPAMCLAFLLTNQHHRLFSE